MYLYLTLSMILINLSVINNKKGHTHNYKLYLIKMNIQVVN